MPKRTIYLVAAVPLLVSLVSGCSSGTPGTEVSASPSPSLAESSPAGRGTLSPGPGAGGISLAGTLVCSTGDIFVMRPDGSHRRRLTDRPGDEFDPSWSPNGRWVVYRDSRRGINNDDEIYIVRADRSGARDVSRNPANEWGPAWSPDGDLIAFNSDRNGWPQIYVMRPDGSRVRRLTDIEGEYPAWSPDGKQIAFMSQDGETGADGAPAYEVYAMDRDGGRQRRITSAPGEDGWPAWSPDGTTIAFSSTRDDTGQLGEDGPLFDIWVMAPDGSGQRRVSERYGQFVTWSPDGRLLVTPGGWLVMPDGSGEMDLPATTRGIAFDFADWLPPGGR